MRIFVGVATLGSFAEAARRLRLSPSAVTRSIAGLEDQLGLTLITRTTRSLRLTGQGEIYLESCQRILEAVVVAEQRARGEDARPRGEMTIAAPVVFGRLHVLPVIGDLLSRHDDLSIRLMLSDRLIHLVEEAVDVAVRIGDLADSSLIALKLGEISRVLVASPAYLARRGSPGSPADLAAHDLVAFEGVDAVNEWRFRQGQMVVRVEPRLTVNSADAAIAAAEAGVGIARALSYQVEASVRAGRLIPVLQSFAPPPSPVSAVYPARRIASVNVAAFVNAAQPYFGGHPLPPADAWP